MDMITFGVIGGILIVLLWFGLFVLLPIKLMASVTAKAQAKAWKQAQKEVIQEQHEADVKTKLNIK